MARLMEYFVVVFLIHKVLSLDSHLTRYHYIDDRLTNIEKRLIAEGKNTRDEFKLVFEKLAEMENLLKTPGSKEITDKQQMHDDIDSDFNKEREQLDAVLINAVKEEKLENHRFRRELERKFLDDSKELKREIHQLSSDTKIQLTNIRDIIEDMAEKQNAAAENMNAIKTQLENISLEINGNICSERNENLFNDIKRKKNEIATSCLDLYTDGKRTSGVYPIRIMDSVVQVYCDMTTDGGGWIVFQRRKYKTATSFAQDWYKYLEGFGDVSGDFWLGNKYIHYLTTINGPRELRVEIEDFSGNKQYAKYAVFEVGPESNKYQLKVSGYSGNAGDGLTEANRNKFMICNTPMQSGWWSRNCFILNEHLNTRWAVRWGTRLIKTSEMKLR